MPFVLSFAIFDTLPSASDAFVMPVLATLFRPLAAVLAAPIPFTAAAFPALASPLPATAAALPAPIIPFKIPAPRAPRPRLPLTTASFISSNCSSVRFDIILYDSFLEYPSSISLSDITSNKSKSSLAVLAAFAKSCDEGAPLAPFLRIFPPRFLFA